MTRAKGIRAILLLLFSLLFAAPVCAQETAVSAEQLKAAFLYNFARFVEWPANAFASDSAPLTLGVVASANDDFASHLASLLKEKKAHNRPFVVKRLTSVADAAGCQMVFVAQGESRKAGPIADLTRKKPVLLVGETEDFLDNGGMICIVQDDKQLRFDINTRTAEQANLTISSHLLRLARNKKTGGAE